MKLSTDSFKRFRLNNLRHSSRQARIKKFGTFGGVFTPDVLTILGVIMYLRLG
jgi:solute carrier family 12 sodium/potassium/chloride transporter 2